MGHYARGSRQVIAVTECPVHDQRGNALAFALGNAFRRGSAGVPGATLKSIAVRVGLGTPEVMATLVVTGDADKGVRAATKRILDSNVAPTSFHLNLHPRDDGFIFGRETRRVRGPERMREQIGDVSYLISPTSFFQTNIRAAEILVRLVLDAGSGGSGHPRPLCRRRPVRDSAGPRGHTVVAVEENATAVADGEASLRLNRVPAKQCRFVDASVEQALANPTATCRPPAHSLRLWSSSIRRATAAPPT